MSHVQPNTKYIDTHTHTDTSPERMAQWLNIVIHIRQTKELPSAHVSVIHGSFFSYGIRMWEEAMAEDRTKKAPNRIEYPFIDNLQQKSEKKTFLRLWLLPDFPFNGTIKIVFFLQQMAS